MLIPAQCVSTRIDSIFERPGQVDRTVGQIRWSTVNGLRASISTFPYPPLDAWHLACSGSRRTIDDAQTGVKAVPEELVTGLQCRLCGNAIPRKL